MQAIRFVAACEALAESFEQAGRIDLATLCDQAAFWLEGGPRIDHLSLDEVVTACREALLTEQQNESDEAFRQHLVDSVSANVRRIEQQVQRSRTHEIELAARLRAVAILTEKLF